MRVPPSGIPLLFVLRGYLAAGVRLACFAVCAVGGLGTLAGAQLVSIKSVPIADGDQFSIYPAQRLGMAGVAIALDDTLLDPFRNPAAGARFSASHFIGSPTVYRVSRDAGGGRTLPVGAFGRSGPWFGTAYAALQEIDEVAFQAPLILPAADLGILGGQSRHNRYAHVAIGRLLSQRSLAVAASLQWSDINALDGLELLYAGSQGIGQQGSAIDLRLGMIADLTRERSLEMVVVHNRFRMTHDVVYADWVFDPVERQTIPQARIEHNLDRTNTWGLHLDYEQPLSAPGWRIGGILTANRMSHPKIPNYEIQNIPRDPGYSNAFDVGIGLSKVDGPATFALDMIYEPIWSDTWAEAAEATAIEGGGTIPAGGKTIENDFRFSNAVVRLGASRELGLGADGPGSTIQLGVAMRSIDYSLEQLNNVTRTSRSLREQWVEWTPAWGLTLRFPEIELRYSGRSTTGTGRPGVGGGGPFPLADAGSLASGRSILVAPSGPLTLDGVRVTTHQVTISLPLK